MVGGCSLRGRQGYSKDFPVRAVALQGSSVQSKDNTYSGFPECSFACKCISMIHAVVGAGARLTRNKLRLREEYVHY